MKEQLLSRVFTSLLEARFPPHQRSGYKTRWIGASQWTARNFKLKLHPQSEQQG